MHINLIKHIKHKILINIFFFTAAGFFWIFSAQTAYAAVSYTIQSPTGELVRGQEYDFIVNINTNGDMIASGAADVTYQSDKLEYVSTTPGSFFSTVTPTVGSTVVTLQGSNESAKSGTGIFATIRFKLIADSAGSTELCTVAPAETPTPTQTPQLTATPVPTTVLPTATPTQIIKTGANTGWVMGYAAAFMIGLGLLGLVVL